MKYSTLEVFGCSMCSSNVEGFPLSLLEAMACGLPIVGYEEPGIKEAIGDKGILLPVGDIDGLAKALKKVIEDEMLRVKLSDMSLKK